MTTGTVADAAASNPPPDGEEIVDAVAVPDDHPPAAAAVPATELVQRPQGQTQLIQAATAADRVAQATEIATALDGIVRAQGMRTKVGSQKKIDPETGEPAKDASGKFIWEPRWHVNVEGWQTLATLLGLAVVPAWTRRVMDPETGKPERVRYPVHEITYHPKSKGGGKAAERTYEIDGYSWEARVEVFKDGVLIGAGEAMCSRAESKWKEADDYAVRGMAQTRATSRAIGAAARWIVTLAGYSGTPAEEMQGVASDQPADHTTPTGLETMPDALAGQLSTDLVFLAGGHLATGGKLWDRLLVDGKMPRIAAEAIIVTAKARRAVDERRAQADAGEPARRPEQAAAEAMQDSEPPASRPAAQGSGRSL